MEITNDHRVNVQEVQMLLGEKDVLIYSLQKQLEAALKRIAELEASLNTMSIPREEL